MREVIAELEGLLAEEANKEHFAGQLMLALYRSGRQAEALDVYQRISPVARRESACNRGPGLQALQAEILDQSGLPPAR